MQLRGRALLPATLVSLAPAVPEPARSAPSSPNPTAGPAADVIAA